MISYAIHSYSICDHMIGKQMDMIVGYEHTITILMKSIRDLHMNTTLLTSMPADVASNIADSCTDFADKLLCTIRMLSDNVNHFALSQNDYEILQRLNMISSVLTDQMKTVMKIQTILTPS